MERKVLELEGKQLEAHIAIQNIIMGIAVCNAIAKHLLSLDKDKLEKLIRNMKNKPA